MGLSVDDILGGAARCRKKAVDYGDGLQFNLHSFTADAFQALAENLCDKDTPATEDDWVAAAMMAIQGEGFTPTPEQIKAFRTKVDKGVIERLALDWLKFNRGAEDLAAAAKKS